MPDGPSDRPIEIDHTFTPESARAGGDRVEAAAAAGAKAAENPLTQHAVLIRDTSTFPSVDFRTETVFQAGDGFSGLLMLQKLQAYNGVSSTLLFDTKNEENLRKLHHWRDQLKDPEIGESLPNYHAIANELEKAIDKYHREGILQKFFAACPNKDASEGLATPPKGVLETIKTAQWRSDHIRTNDILKEVFKASVYRDYEQLGGYDLATITAQVRMYGKEMDSKILLELKAEARKRRNRFATTRSYGGWGAHEKLTRDLEHEVTK